MPPPGMETLTRKRRRRSPSPPPRRRRYPSPPPRRRRSPSPPPPGPHSVLLKPNVNDEADRDSVADAKTTAASCTSSGQRFTISFALAPPPATSSFYCDWIGGAPGDEGDHNSSTRDVSIIAAHDDAVLFQMGLPDRRRGDHSPLSTYDHFLYETGGAAARPPSLSLLPSCDFSRQFQRGSSPGRSPRGRYLDANDTGVLRRGDGELLVAQLEVTFHAPYRSAELCVLRPGHGWAVRDVPIVHHDGGRLRLERRPELNATVPVGSRFMCWVDYTIGLFLCDMAAAEGEDPKLWYVPLPVPPPDIYAYDGHRPYMAYCQNLAGAGASAVRFVSVAPRCCCGGAGKTECERSRFAFNVTIWTMTLRTWGRMTWVKDGVFDCDELWHQPNYGRRLPRVVPRWPIIVSSDNPDVVCFKVCKDYCSSDCSSDDDDGERTEWMLQVDTRRKKLLSVSDTDRYMDERVRAKLRWQ